MKNLLFAMLVIALLATCKRPDPSVSEKEEKNRNSALMDTLGTMDSLVNVNKVRNNQLTRELAGKALNLARQSGSEEALAKAYLMMGIAFRNYNNDTSIFYNMLAMRLSEKNNLARIRISSLYNYATLCQDASDHKAAVLYYDSIISLARREQSYGMLSNSFIGIGTIKLMSFDSTGARVMFDSAFKVAARFSLRLQKGVALANLARLENDPKRKLLVLRSAINLLKEIPGAEEEAAASYSNLGMLSPDPDTALRYYNEALRLADVVHATVLSIAICNNKAYCYLDKKDFKNAESCLVSYAIPLAKKEKKILLAGQFV